MNRAFCANYLFSGLLLAVATLGAPAKELHVAPTGSDSNPGKKSAPLRTIQRAADLAQPGDVVTVHAGTYRERISPPRGGTSDRKRIVFQAARGEKVEIKGSEVVTNWEKAGEGVWKATLPNALFGKFNPYSDLIRGDWFNAKHREHHTGAVYLNGEWLMEAAKLEDVLDPTGGKALWFGRVEADTTTLWARFNGVDPNRELVEINARQSVFYPDQPGRNYITVRGFTMRHAATPWAPPTAEQIGLIGTHWSKGWIIEDNVISHSKCSGVTLGKHGDEFDNTSANSAEGYVKTIERGLARGWNRETIGHHLVRNNTISHCEQTGICGSLGAVFSTITGNHIHDIHVRRLFTGAEMGGIKLHAAIDTTISGNYIHHAYRGLWLDWMAQGTRVTGNLLHDNTAEDIYAEVNHGPYLVDNNLLLSSRSVWDMSEGGAYAHNLMTGRMVTQPERARETPWHPAHRTSVAGLKNIQGGDDRFYNNLFVGNGTAGPEPDKAAPQHSPRGAGYGLVGYDVRDVPSRVGGNVFYHGAQPCARETNAVVASANPSVRLEEKDGHVFLHLQTGPELKGAKTTTVTTELLGRTRISGLPYENPDGKPVKINTDYLGRKRSGKSPTSGPFEAPGEGAVTLKVW